MTPGAPAWPVYPALFVCFFLTLRWAESKLHETFDADLFFQMKFEKIQIEFYYEMSCAIIPIFTRVHANHIVLGRYKNRSRSQKSGRLGHGCKIVIRKGFR